MAMAFTWGVRRELDEEGATNRHLVVLHLWCQVTKTVHGIITCRVGAAYMVVDRVWGSRLGWGQSTRAAAATTTILPLFLPLLPFPRRELRSARKVHPGHPRQAQGA